jgi:hypothetical protein
MPPDDPLDAAVRAHLDAEAAAVDARRVLAGVKARQANSRLTPSTRRRWLRWATLGAAAVAACLLVGLFLTGQDPVPVGPPRTATAAEIIEEAKTVHEAAGVDRCYQVAADWDIKPMMPRLGPARTATVWTRGDQFVVLSSVDDGPAWAWGQEPGGGVWLVPNRKHAIVFTRDELNDPLARHCELMSLRLASTLGEVLEKYELFRKDGGEPDEPIRIEANLRPNVFPGARFRKIELELEPVTKTVRKAVFHRYLNGAFEGTITFNLTDTATQPDDFYTLKGHTDPRAVIHDGKPMPNPPPPPNSPRAKFRDELLKRWQSRGK